MRTETVREAVSRRLSRVLGMAVVTALSGSLALAAPPAGAEGRPATPLFAASPAAAVDLVDEVGVVRSRPVRVRFEALTEPGTAPRSIRRGRQRIELNLFPDVAFIAVLDGEITPTTNGLAWVGHLEGVEDGLVILAAGGGVLAGSVTLPGAAYRVAYAPGGVHVVQELDASAFPPEVEMEPPPPPEDQDDLSSVTERMRARTAAADSGSRIDVLIFYTPAARLAAGGVSAIESQINLAVSATNQALSSSGVATSLRLIRTEEVAYTESGNLATDLGNLTGPINASIDQIHGIRDFYGADLVQLVVNTSADPNVCGVAHKMRGSDPGFEDLAFSVARRGCINFPYYTTGHELGHNMGCNHDPADANSGGPGAAYYAYGYKDPESFFRTIMATDCSPSCTRILRFSNPDPIFNYSGRPTGTITQHNARSINDIRTVVANFRQERHAYEGVLETANCRQISGWAWDGVFPNSAINVDVLRDSSLVATRSANICRQDLVNAGKGNGCHGFSYVPSSSWRDGQWHAAGARFTGKTTQLASSPRNMICGVPIFTSQVPQESLSTGGLVYSVATQFSSAYNGYVTQLGFHRASGETGTNTLRLWTDAGVQLASVTTSCTAAGWCWAGINPVAITAGTRYRVSVNTNTFQSKTGCGIGSGITNQQVLTAHQGFWLAGNTFPTTGSCSNFFVDVKFDL